MKKRILLLALLIACFALPVFAVQVTVDWNWAKNDSAVQYFRYQLDGEADDGWTVVSSNVTNYSVSGLDGSKSYTLYLQQSYDGVYWSESASSTSQPAVPAEAAIEEPVITEEAVPAAVTEPETAAEETPAAVEETPAEAVPLEEVPAVAVEETPAPAAAEAVSSPSTFKFTLTLGTGPGLNNIGETLNYDIQGVIGLGFEDIVANDIAGWDIRMNLGYIGHINYDISDMISDMDFGTFFNPDNYTHGMFADLLTGFNLKAGSTQFYLDGGARLLMMHNAAVADPLFELGDFDGLVQITGILGFRWNIGWFSLGLEGQYVYDFDANSHAVTPRLYMGFSF